MLDIKEIRKNKEFYIKKIADRGVSEESIDTLIELDENHRIILKELETLRHEKNTASDSIQEFKKKRWMQKLIN